MTREPDISLSTERLLQCQEALGQLQQARAEIERLKAAHENRGGEMDSMREVLATTQKWNEDRVAEVERLKMALRGLLDEVMCFSVDPPSATLNRAIEEATSALKPKP